MQVFEFPFLSHLQVIGDSFSPSHFTLLYMNQFNFTRGIGNEYLLIDLRVG